MLRARFLLRAGYWCLRPVSAWFRARARHRAVEATGRLTSARTLVIAPHPDDETLGCGGTILRLRDAGYPVHVLVATDGAGSHGSDVIAPADLAQLRRDEMLEAARRLGLDAGDVTFLGHPDGELASVQDTLTDEIRAALSRFRPGQVLVTSRLDAHPDHRTCALATEAAVIDGDVHASVYEYPVWYWERLPWIHRPRGLGSALRHLFSDPVAELRRPRVLGVDVTRYLDGKQRALDAHASQVSPFGPLPGPPHLPPAFLAQFLREREYFFLVVPSHGFARRSCELNEAA